MGGASGCGRCGCSEGSARTDGRTKERRKEGASEPGVRRPGSLGMGRAGLAPAGPARPPARLLGPGLLEPSTCLPGPRLVEPSGLPSPPAGAERDGARAPGGWNAASRAPGPVGYITAARPMLRAEPPARTPAHGRAAPRLRGVHPLPCPARRAGSARSDRGASSLLLVRPRPGVFSRAPEMVGAPRWLRALLGRGGKGEQRRERRGEAGARAWKRARPGPAKGSEEAAHLAGSGRDGTGGPANLPRLAGWLAGGGLVTVDGFSEPTWLKCPNAAGGHGVTLVTSSSK